MQTLLVVEEVSMMYEPQREALESRHDVRMQRPRVVLRGSCALLANEVADPTHSAFACKERKGSVQPNIRSSQGSAELPGEL